MIEKIKNPIVDKANKYEDYEDDVVNKDILELSNIQKKVCNFLDSDFANAENIEDEKQKYIFKKLRSHIANPLLKDELGYQKIAEGIVEFDPNKINEAKEYLISYLHKENSEKTGNLNSFEVPDDLGNPDVKRQYIDNLLNSFFKGSYTHILGTKLTDVVSYNSLAQHGITLTEKERNLIKKSTNDIIKLLIGFSEYSEEINHKYKNN